MVDKPNTDGIKSLYYSMLADVELGLRLEHHLKDINEALPVIDEKIHQFMEKEKENESALAATFEFGYCLYHLRDRILELLKERVGINKS